MLTVSEFGRVCERRKFKSVCKSKVRRYSRYENGGRVHVRLNV